MSTERLRSISWNWLYVFLDPRFRTHPCLTAQQCLAARERLAQWAYDLRESTPNLQEHFRQVAAHPDNRTLLQCARESISSGRGHAVGEGRPAPAVGPAKSCRQKPPKGRGSLPQGSASCSETAQMCSCLGLQRVSRESMLM